MTNKGLTRGSVQETLLIPLYARAVEARKRRPLLRDPKAIEIVESLDYDFRKFDKSGSLFGAVLRTAMFDEWVRAFIVRHPNGTVIELGAGLNARFERLDNERTSWVDVDLPDVASLRSSYFPNHERHLTIGGSVTETSWITQARERPGPYFLVAEAVFMFLTESEVRGALAAIAAGFPGAWLAFDTGSQQMIDDQLARGVMSGMAPMSWACDHPRVVEDWDIGMTLLESRTFLDAPAHLKRYEPFTLRWLAPIFFRGRIEAYRLNLFQVGPGR